MAFTRIHYISIIGIVLLSLIGLSTIQFSWLKNTIEIRKAKLDDHLQEVLSQLNEELEVRWEGKQPITLAGLARNTEYASSYVHLAGILIDSILYEEGINISYEYGVKTCLTKEFIWYSNSSLSNEIACGKQVRLGNGSNLKDGEEGEHLHLYTHFSSKEKAIMPEVRMAIGSSILFILLLIIVFGYLLYTILKQKKLTQIKNDFINNLTHELKTPLASISLAAKTLHKLPHVSGSTKAKSYVDLIDQEGKRLGNHINNVLQMASLDSGNFALDIKEIDTHEIVQKVGESLSLLLNQKQGILAFKLEADNFMVYADPSHFFNIIYNLVDNAVKYNTGKPIIKIKTENKGREFIVSVIDNGIGIAPEVQNQIFDPFYREATGDVHDVKGFGIGLSYVKKMMEAHGGTIDLESKKKEGTTISLHFPFAH